MLGQCLKWPPLGTQGRCVDVCGPLRKALGTWAELNCISLTVSENWACPACPLSALRFLITDVIGHTLHFQAWVPVIVFPSCH